MTKILIAALPGAPLSSVALAEPATGNAVQRLDPALSV